MANILFIIEHLKGGGAERVVSEISAELETTHNVSIVVFEDRGTTYRHCKNIIDISIPGASSSHKKVINLIKRVRAVRRIKKQNGIDISISFISNANIVNVLSGNSYIVCSIRTVLSSVVKGRISRYLEAWPLKKADTVVALSNYVGKDLEDNFGINRSKIRTIYNPIFKVSTSVEVSRDDKSESALRFITAGRLVTAKGQWHLIKTFYAFHKEYGGHLTILGEGRLEEKLKQLVAFLGIEESVSFKGFVENPVSEFIQSDVFVFTSLWEGFGNAIIEAMDSGLPVICSNCPGGPQEILDPNDTRNGMIAEFGLLTPPFPQIEDLEYESVLTAEENKLLEAMRAMADKTMRRHYSSKSKERARAFKIDVITAYWNSLINNCLNK